MYVDRTGGWDSPTNWRNRCWETGHVHVHVTNSRRCFACVLDACCLLRVALACMHLSVYLPTSLSTVRITYIHTYIHATYYIQYSWRRATSTSRVFPASSRLLSLPLSLSLHALSLSLSLTPSASPPSLCHCSLAVKLRNVFLDVLQTHPLGSPSHAALGPEQVPRLKATPAARPTRPDFNDPLELK